MGFEDFVRVRSGKLCRARAICVVLLYKFSLCLLFGVQLINLFRHEKESLFFLGKERITVLVVLNLCCRI